MLSIFINLLLFVLIMVSLFMVIVILMQRANTNAGMGSAFGGGMAESAFGAETTTILTKATKWAAVTFFSLALVLYLLYMARAAQAEQAVDDAGLPLIATETAEVEAAPLVPDATITADDAVVTTESENMALELEAAATEAETAATDGETPNP